MSKNIRRCFAVCFAFLFTLTQACAADKTENFQRIDTAMRDIIGEYQTTGKYADYYHTKVTDYGVEVQYYIDDSFTAGLIRSAVYRNTTKMMQFLSGINKKRAAENEIEYNLNVQGVFTLVDIYGNESVEKVIDIVIMPEVIGKINYDYFLPKNIPDIADTCWIHPAIRD